MKSGVNLKECSSSTLAILIYLELTKKFGISVEKSLHIEQQIICGPQYFCNVTYTLYSTANQRKFASTSKTNVYCSFFYIYFLFFIDFTLHQGGVTLHFFEIFEIGHIAVDQDIFLLVQFKKIDKFGQDQGNIFQRKFANTIPSF